MEHDPSHHEQEAYGCAFLIMKETLYAADPAQPGYRVTGRGPEEVHADAEQDRI